MQEFLWGLLLPPALLEFREGGVSELRELLQAGGQHRLLLHDVEVDAVIALGDEVHGLEGTFLAGLALLGLVQHADEFGEEVHRGLGIEAMLLVVMVFERGGVVVEGER